MCINVKGSLALNAGRYYEAFEAFYRPLRMNLENRLYIPLFLSNCAAAMYELGKFEEALEYTQRALAVNPPQQTAVTMLAHSQRGSDFRGDGQKCRGAGGVSEGDWR